MTSKRLTREIEQTVRTDPVFQAALVASRRVKWRTRALCNKFPLELFYPSGYTTAEDKAQAARAVSICQQCSVRTFCLRETLEVDDRWGVRGGYDEPTRKFYHQVYEKYYRVKGSKPPSVAELVSGLIPKKTA